MIFFPYSTALTLANPPKMTYAIILVCLLVFWFQTTSGITSQLIYYPDSWNPLTMVTSSFAHADILHLLFNMIFFLAFAPALEAIIGNTLRYVLFILLLSFVVGICYSISILVGGSAPIPTLGFSGVVMGFIGLSAFMMPHARIRFFWWLIVFWKTVYIRAWIVAVFYIGVDAWSMFTLENYNGINLVAHVAGGIGGYLYGYLRLRERKEEIAEELNEEIEEMKLEQRLGKDKSMSMRGRKKMDDELAEKRRQKENDRLMGQVYQRVTTKNDSEAIIMLLQDFDIDDLSSQQVEALYERVKQWGPSRTLLCLGRLNIYLLDREKRFGRALYYIEQCQLINPLFLLPDLSRTLHYAQAALNVDKITVAKNLLANPTKRYVKYVNIELLKTIAHRIKLIENPGIS